MLYFVNWDGDMSAWPPWYGILRSPRSASAILTREGQRMWCGDNDAFHDLFEPATFRHWLAKMRPFQSNCVFIACPDVVADAKETHERWCEWAPIIDRLGYRPAFVLQDGQNPDEIPALAEVLFLGGSTEFKLSDTARACIAEGKKRLAWVHIGRVNSQKRLAYFAPLGADSADGTTINRGPEVKRKMLDSQLRQRALIYE